MLKIRASLLIPVILLVLVLGSVEVLSIPRRQDPDMPVENLIRIDSRDFLKYLELLRSLNDSVVDNYIDAIKKALEEGDYETANKLLTELKKYLSEKYGENLPRDTDLLKALATISSTEALGSSGAYLNISKLLEVYGDLINDEELIEIARKIAGLGEVSPEEQYKIYEVLSKVLGSGFKEVNVSELFQLLNETSGVAELIQQPKLPSNQGVFFPTKGVPEAPQIPSILLLILGIGGVILGVSILLKLLPSPITIKLKSFVSSKLGGMAVKAVAQISSIFFSREKDPVVRIYKTYYFTARAKGFKKYRHETPREFLEKITDANIKAVGVPVTRIYEERVYGGKTPGKEELRRVIEILRSKLGVRIESTD